MTFEAAPVSSFKRFMTAPRTAVALLSALLFVAVLHLGLGADIGSSLSTTLGAGDQAVLRHSVLVRDGLRPVVAAEHGDRTSVPPPPQSPAALALVAAITARHPDFLRRHAIAEAIPARSYSAGHRPRAPPIAV